MTDTPMPPEADNARTQDARAVDPKLAMLTRQLASERRSVTYWVDQHRLAETGRLQAVRRGWMLTECLARHGLLDEAGMRETYIDETAHQIQTTHDVERLEDFRLAVVQVAYEAENAISRGADADAVLAAVLKALHRNITRTNKKALPIAAARKQSAEHVANIPTHLPRPA
ncbi:hypothetical protein [Nocardia wallacei]|uniref:hypothetical protein n=1 Tax=Nocardia wallacei TaxID=480035 RepID=UPI002457FA50|nr:hypothetical protein [Nocardia wallacei]